MFSPTAGYDIGDIIKGRYKVKAHLGRGRLGVAIKAHDIKKSRPVVLKLIHPGLLPDDDSRDRFVAAVKPMVGIDSPYAAYIFDVVRDRRKTFVVREFLTGVTLKHLMDEQKVIEEVFPNDEAVQIIKNLSNAFAARGRVHGLFSPTKVWVTPETIKVVDCGVASAIPPAALWHASRKSGMKRYVAPELLENRPPTPTSDVYAMGVLLGEMLSLVEYSGEVGVFREAEPDFSMEVEALIRCALSPDPDARYKDVIEFVSALFDITGRKRTSLMPPDNTAVVPFRFLNELRSMSVVPPMPSRAPEDSYDTDPPEEITRQVPAASITEDNPNAGAVPTPSVQPAPQPDESDEFLYDDGISEEQEPGFEEMAPPGDIPADAFNLDGFAPDEDPTFGFEGFSPEDIPDDLFGQAASDVSAEVFDRDEGKPMAPREPFGEPIDEYDVDDLTSEVEPEEVLSEDDLLWEPEPASDSESVPRPPTPTLPRPSVREDSVSTSKPLPLMHRAYPASTPPLTPSAEPSVSVPRPHLPKPSSVPRPQSAPPPRLPISAAPLPPKPSTPADAEIDSSADERSERLEGINPRFLRAAAKLEKAKIGQVQTSPESTREDEEEWRKRLEESSTGSVISFLPPEEITEDSQPIKGFPHNQQPQKPRIPPVPSNLPKPPPLPKKGK